MAEDIEEILAEIDAEQMEVYKKFFEMFDKDKKGYVMVIQVGQVMDAMQQDYDEKTLRKTVRKFDADGSGKLEFEEFAAMVYTLANSVDKETMEKELREAFRLFDKEVPCYMNTYTRNGFISRDSMKALLREIDDKLTEAELDAAIDEIDEDGSGKIEFEEFFELMAGE